MDIPYLSSDEMAKVDEMAPEKYGVTISRMMENAAYQIADFIRQNYGKDTQIVFYIGKGNNGGDGLAAVRRLHNWGFNVEFVLLTNDLDGIRAEELKILEGLGVKIKERVEAADVAVDCLIGYNLDGDLRAPFDKLADQVNTAEEVISVDIPTGVNADTGETVESAVRADKVLTLAMPKKGLKQINADIWILDISIPNQVYEELGFETVNLFQKSSRVFLE